MKKLHLILFFALISIQAFAGLFSSYNYITGDELANWIKSKKQFIIVDIQPKKDFDDEHIVGAIPTYAFPAKKDEEKKRLDPVIEKIKQNNLPVIVVCPAGKTGAENAYNYIKSKGIDEKRLYILKGGMGSWTHNEFSEPK
ncbi:rhodanese-like domain-containing protein [Calditerrivibrio nitroreducens]|uniref:Rhodanese domain protein n=1 Tax=Calditerrivibrio nitroreducens (strain DSM 19672 / NBRC 101217 / Yu37-1) TaxID=768670 RepID=E4TIS9_CALNY|nr:rhodanese-like domain-containing protein [Calditerrivibrio nitroreducens]ADR18034.1 Rhodanese domain protein [Calditerrivibrio nitroreducens DSM 19672]